MKKLLLLLLMAAVVFPEQVIANGFTKNAAGIKRFVFTGLVANSSISMRILGWPRDKVTTPNACGLTVIAPSKGATIMQIAFPGASMVDASSLPVQTLPVCSSGVLAEARTANFKTATGSVILIGQAAGSVRIIQDINRTVKTDGCGIAKLTPPKQSFSNGWWFEGTSFVVGNQTLYADDLLSSEEKSICKKVGAQSLKYAPLIP